HWGYVCAYPRPLPSGFVSWTGVPPSCATRHRPLLSDGAYTIVPSAHHDPPHGLAASASGRGAPPETATRRSLPPAKKATDRPSGEKNGSCAPRLPSTVLATKESIDRRYNCEVSRVRPAA